MENKTLAIIALVLAIVVPVAGLILGIIALYQIKKSGGEGKGIAIAAIIVSIAIIILIIFLTALPLI